jgi:hypothetical protein
MKLIKSDSPIVINGDNTLHITGVSVFTGPDDYIISDFVEIKANQDHDLIITNRKKQKPMGRLKGDLGATLNISSESGKEYAINIYSHKGQVLINIFEKSIDNNI